jgi:hypothetical protein
MNNDFQISTPSVSFASQGAAKGGVLTTRTSSKMFQSVGAGREVFFESDWQGLNSYSVKRTTSFSDIHQEVAQSVSYMYSSTPANETGGSRPGVPTTGNGDTPPPTGELLPIGDMLIPMLIIALGYIVVKLFRNRKTSQAL